VRNVSPGASHDESSDIARQAGASGNVEDIDALIGHHAGRPDARIRPGLASPRLDGCVLRGPGPASLCRAPNEQFSGLLHAKGIPHSLHVWTNSKHDWPYWRPMAQAYLP